MQSYKKTAAQIRNVSRKKEKKALRDVSPDRRSHPRVLLKLSIKDLKTFCKIQMEFKTNIRLLGMF
jgi:hypothetical protein